MNKFFNFVFTIILTSGCLLGQTDHVSKAGTTAASFLEIGAGAVSTALGGAAVSVASDASVLYWNPAGLSRLSTNTAILYHADWLADTKYNFAGLAIPVEGLGAIGLSFISLSMNDMAVRTVDLPEGTGEFFSAGDFAIGLSIGRNLTNRFSIGFTAKYIQQTIWHMSSSAFALDAGTMFKTDLFNGMVIGASITNFGTTMKLEGRDSRTYRRIDENITGSNDRIPYNIDMDSWDLPLCFRIGVSTDVYKTTDYRITAALDALHPNNNYESINAGAEFAFRDYLFVRGGFRSLFLEDNEGGLSLGVGLSSKILFSEDLVFFDYAYQDYGRLKSINSFSLSVRF